MITRRTFTNIFDEGILFLSFLWLINKRHLAENLLWGVRFEPNFPFDVFIFAVNEMEFQSNGKKEKKKKKKAFLISKLNKKSKTIQKSIRVTLSRALRHYIMRPPTEEGMSWALLELSLAFSLEPSHFHSFLPSGQNPTFPLYFLSFLLYFLTFQIPFYYPT